MKSIRLLLPTVLLASIVGCQSTPAPTAADRENSQKPSPSASPNGAQVPH